MRRKVELDSTNLSSVYRRRYKQLQAKCSYCPWHKKENAGRKPRHGVRKRNKISRGSKR